MDLSKGTHDKDRNNKRGKPVLPEAPKTKQKHVFFKKKLVNKSKDGIRRSAMGKTREVGDRYNER